MIVGLAVNVASEMCFTFKIAAFIAQLASIEVWKQSINSRGCIFELEFKQDGTSWRKGPCEICHCQVKHEAFVNLIISRRMGMNPNVKMFLAELLRLTFTINVERLGRRARGLPFKCNRPAHFKSSILTGS